MKRILIIAALVLGLFASGGWLWFHGRDARQANMVAFESDVTESLIQGIMQEMDADQPKFYFVGFGREKTDPSRLFIARFATHVPQVRGASSAFMKRNGHLMETSSGRTGVTIQILRLKPIKASQDNGGGGVEALVVFPKSPADENRFNYRLVQDGGKWVIKYKLATKL